MGVANDNEEALVSNERHRVVFFEEAEMIQTSEGVFLVTNGVLSGLDLKMGENYFIFIQEAVLTSIKVLQ